MKVQAAKREQVWRVFRLPGAGEFTRLAGPEPYAALDAAGRVVGRSRGEAEALALAGPGGRVLAALGASS